MSPSTTQGRSSSARLREELSRATPERRRAAILSLPPDVAAVLAHDWEGVHALPNQVRPDWAWTIWLVLAGRGFGKTRTGAEWILSKVSGDAGESRAKRLTLIAATAADIRDTMIEGESGLLTIAPPWNRPDYEPSKRRLTWKSGAVAVMLSADRPDRLRGPQCDTFWADELAAWRYPEAWAQLQLGFRLGRPQGVVTTTPRPIPVLRSLLRREGRDVAVSRGTTYDNRANLAPEFFDSVCRLYEGTRIGRQELHAEVLDDNPGAMWKRDQLDALRVASPPGMQRIVVAIDPAVSTNEDSDETGIVVAGLAGDRHVYVLEDRSGVHTPLQWANEAISAYRRWKADRVVAEVNQGGDLVVSNLRNTDDTIPVRTVHATRGKAIRAEPVAGLYEQGRVHHVGVLAKLEDQMCNWDPATPAKATRDERGERDGVGSPDRIDALVWAVTELMELGVGFKSKQKLNHRRDSILDEGGW